MKAFVSGQLGLAITHGLRQAAATDFSAAVTVISSEGQPNPRFFDGATDIKTMDFTDSGDLEIKAQRAWAEDRALRLTLFLIEGEDPIEDLKDYADCVEELIEKFDVDDFLTRNLLSAPLPENISLASTAEIAKSYPRLSLALSKVDDLQTSISAVSEAFNQIPLKEFEAHGGRKIVHNRLKQSGSFADIANALSGSGNLAFTILKAKSQNRALVSILDRWTSALGLVVERRHKNWADIEEEQDDDEFLREIRVGQSYEIYQRVRSQQNAILEKLKIRDLNAARKLCDEMISGQVAFSTADQTAKSLCAVAQIAKSQGIPELQLEWAKWATLVNPSDPKTYGHYADALLALSSFREARLAFDAVESAGDPCFAATGRARVTRNMGDIVGARAAFLEVGKNYADYDGVEFALILAAETLRDMSDSAGALTEYQTLTEKFPTNSAVWAGLASCLMDLGRFDDAIRNFGRSEKHKSRDGGIVAKNGKATAYKLSGRFEEALEIYDQIVAIAPNDFVGLCGRADTFRASGKLDDALDALNIACERAPYAVTPFASRANLLADMRRYEEASQAYTAARERFPYDRSLTMGQAAILRRTGRHSEALAAYDELIAIYPFDFAAKCSRAAVLNQLSRHQEALTAYEEVLKARPYMSNAILGRASTLIQVGRAPEIITLSSNLKPKSLFEWRLFTIGALAQAEAGTLTSASRLLERGVRFCPFASERRILRSSLASIKIQIGKAREAAVIVDVPESDVSNVVQLHAFAAARNSERALAVYESIKRSEPSAHVIQLADEIAKRHKLAYGERAYSNTAIWKAERSLLLLDAA